MQNNNGKRSQRVLPTRHARKQRISSNTEKQDEVVNTIPKVNKFVKDCQKTIKIKAFEELLAIRAGNAGKAKRGDIQSIVTKYRNGGFLYVTRRCLECFFDRLKKGLPISEERSKIAVVGGAPTLIEKDVSDLTNPMVPINEAVPVHDNEANGQNEAMDENETVLVTTTSTSTSKSKSSKSDLKKQYVLRKSMALTEVTKAYYSIQEANHNKPKATYVQHGVLHNLIYETEVKYGLEEGTIKRRSVLARIGRNNLEGAAKSRTSPLAPLEPEIVNWCLELARMGAPLTREQVVALTRELIHKTEFENDLVAFKKARRIMNDDGTVGKVGRKWYEGFAKRHSFYIRRSKSKIKEKLRQTWCTYIHFANMYEAAYKSMVKCGVAEELETAIMMDKNGKPVYDKKLMHGRPTKFRLLHPENCVYVDETGCNTNMKLDPTVGNTKFVLPNDQSGSAPTGITTDLHFTVLCFSSGTGKPIMCAIIFASEKETDDIPLAWRYGLDETKDIIPGENENDMFQKNFGEGKAMQGGPKCWFKGHHIPCFIGSSPKSSITSELLAKMLEQIDSFHVFDRSNGRSPFLLLDGHHSRFQLPFLNYINRASTLWTTNIGVPYGTHLWQVADSAEMNGSFKTAFTKAKLEYISNNKDGMKERFTPSDIIPLVRMAWADSFARDEVCERAIKDRGWGPLNYLLLDHPNIIHTAPGEDLAGEVGSLICPSIMTDIEIARRVNLDGVTTNKLATICIEERMKSTAKNDIYLKGKENEKENKNNREKLKAWLRNPKNWRSGKFASNNKFGLTDQEFLEAVQERHDEIERERIVSAIRVKNLKKKRDADFKVSFQKYKKGKPLTIEDMKVMLGKTKKEGDKALASKKNEVTLQWEERKHRLDVYIEEDLNMEDIVLIENVDQNWHGMDLLAQVSLVQDCEGITGTGTSTSISTTLDATNENIQGELDFCEGRTKSVSV